MTAVVKFKDARGLRLPPDSVDDATTDQTNSQNQQIIKGFEPGEPLQPGDPPEKAEAKLRELPYVQAFVDAFIEAKDTPRVMESIKYKLRCQVEYIIWRDTQVSQGQRTDLIPYGNKLPPSDPGEVTASRWRIRFLGRREARAESIASAMDKFESEVYRAQQGALGICLRDTIRGTEGTGECLLYTPAEYIEMAREVLGEIELDPASDEAAQKTVRATRYYTEKMDGIQLSWESSGVWLNPPYSRKLLPQFAVKLAVEFAKGNVQAAIMLTNACPDTAWFRAASTQASQFCFPAKRLKFYNPTKAEFVNPTQGQMFVWFCQPNDDRYPRFERVFSKIGVGFARLWGYIDEEAFIRKIQSGWDRESE